MPVAALGLVHVVRADQHGEPGGGERVDLLPELAPACGSTPAVGSSSSSSCGSCRMQAASARRCFQPPESWPASWRPRAPRPSRSSAALDRLAALRHRVDPRDEVEVLAHAQVLPEAEALGHVADLALDRRAPRSGCRGRGRCRCPPSGVSRPQSMRMVVVLPLPLGPRKPKISPSQHAQREVLDDALAAEALAQPRDVDRRPARSPLMAPRAGTSTGWPGCSRAARPARAPPRPGRPASRGSRGCRSPAACTRPRAR